jgi:hypothetical protein
MVNDLAGNTIGNRPVTCYRISGLTAAAVAARDLCASELFTGDFNHGQDYGGIQAINPFR